MTNPIQFVVKPDDSLRLVSNLCALNDIVKKDPYQLPLMRDVIAATQGAVRFTVIYFKEAFHYIEIEEAHKEKTAFEFRGKVLEWNGIMMGFRKCTYDYAKSDLQNFFG